MPMQRLIPKWTAKKATRVVPPRPSLPEPPYELVERLTRFHASESRNEKSRNKDEPEEHARSILRWMQESPKCGNETDLKHMVDEYVDKRTPLAYILGNQPFGNVNILVEPPVLIPRPETEEWTMRLIEQLKRKRKGNLTAPARVLDLCSGSGCISISLAKAAPDFFITGLDVSEKSIELAKRNAIENKVQNVVFKQVDIFHDEELDNARLTKYDMIISNPPYITPAQYNTLDKSVKDHEDIRALLGKYSDAVGKDRSSTSILPEGSGESGLDFYYRIRDLASRLLSPHQQRVLTSDIPSLILEFGIGQGQAIKEIFKESYNCTIRKDFNGIERTIDLYQPRRPRKPV